MEERGFTVAVLLPMGKEFDLLSRSLRSEPVDPGGAWGIGPVHGLPDRYAGHSVYLIQSGIGKVNTAHGALYAIHSLGAHVLLMVGVAGGLSAELDVGDRVVSSFTMYHDVWCGAGNASGQVQGCPERFQCEWPWRASQAGEPVSVGAIVTGERFIPDEAELLRIRAMCPEALAVDMESAALGQIAHAYRLPYGVLRIISDTPVRSGVDHAVQYGEFWRSRAKECFARAADYLTDQFSQLSCSAGV